ncbi:MAG: plasmid recombination protein [Alistipes sp.]|nr:plasmid recombination protein [Alistipes sp.]MCD7795619.1 plasmid recombination protein [Alistipes sp.]MCD8274452.1 plasmid recombination protein [Alistipes sp.]
MSAVLHMDEKMPYIHATVVPIVRDERWTAKLKRVRNVVSEKRT